MVCLLLRRGRSHEGAVAAASRPDPRDAVVLEASGLADPHGIAQVALANPAIRLDGVLTLVDGETFLERIGNPGTLPTVYRSSSPPT